MISLYNRSKSAFCFPIVLLSLGLISSCTTTRPDPKEDLVRSLKGANVEGYYFATEEDDARATASLTNSAVRNLIKLDSGAANVILRYTSVRDKKTNSTRTYRTEIVKAGTELSLLATDIATGEAVIRETFNAPEPRNKPATGCGPPVFDSVQACERDFDCTQRGAIQCAANSTCEAQFADLDCCLSNGTEVNLLLVISPNTLICQLRELIPDLAGFMLSQ